MRLSTLAQCIFLLLVLTASLWAQTAALRGVVTDQSGAIVPKATVGIKGPGGTKTTTTGNDGGYVFTGLPAGEYAVDAKAPQLVLAEVQKVSLASTTQTLNLVLTVAPQKRT